jgi:hypothetical protein
VPWVWFRQSCIVERRAGFEKLGGDVVLNVPDRLSCGARFCSGEQQPRRLHHNLGPIDPVLPCNRFEAQRLVR